MSRVFYGWYVVAATFLVLFAGFGVVYSFGAFFLALSAEFGAGRAAIASVFSGAVFTLFMTGALAGMLADRIGPRPVIGAGIVSIAAGLVFAAGADRLWQLFACYTIGVGVGVGLVYVPAISAVQRWFERRRGLASGIAVTGIGLGTLVMPIIVGVLLESIDWREVFHWLAVLIVLLGAVGVAVIESDPRKRGLAPDGGEVSTVAATTAVRGHDSLGEIVKSRPFVQFYAASSILSVPVFIPFVHLVASAQDMGIGRTQAVATLGLIGLGSTAGRFIVGGFADRIGRRRALIVMLGGIGASYVVWLSAGGLVMLAGFALGFGVCYGAYVALSPALLADYFAGPKLSSAIGFQYTAAGLGSILGPVLAGYLFDISGSYSPALATGALCSAIACYLVVRMPEPAAYAAARAS